MNKSIYFSDHVFWVRSYQQANSALVLYSEEAEEIIFEGVHYCELTRKFAGLKLRIPGQDETEPKAGRIRLAYPVFSIESQHEKFLVNCLSLRIIKNGKQVLHIDVSDPGSSE